jgi:hypothetical protein
MILESRPIQNQELRLDALCSMGCEAILDVRPPSCEYADEDICEL